MKQNHAEFSTMTGRTLTSIEGCSKESEEITFHTNEGDRFVLSDPKDYSLVQVEDICGDVTDLIGTPILQAEETSSNENPPDRPHEFSFTWTFYRISTIKGQVVIRWLGESNGYYAESAYFYHYPASA